MKTIIKNASRLVLILSLSTTGFLINSVAYASDHETQCFNDIQAKTPWNDEGNMNWDAENIKQLCEGTAKPAEPGKCFTMVRTGRVKWGNANSSTQWDWKNIINLCSGTSDAEKTVDCFNSGVSSGSDWRDAILTCQRALSGKTKSNTLNWNQ